MSTWTHGASVTSDTRVIGRRAAATIIDYLLLGTVGAVLSVPGEFVGDLADARVGAFIDGLAGGQVTDGVSLVLLLGATLAALTIVFAYFVILEGLYGQTLGKMALGIKVVGEDGTPAGPGAAVLRTLLRPIDGWLFFYGVAFIAALLSEKNRRLGDMVAKTLVVRV